MTGGKQEGKQEGKVEGTWGAQSNSRDEQYKLQYWTEDGGIQLYFDPG
jgi:hypothetical protein